MINKEYFSSYLTGIFEASGNIVFRERRHPYIYIYMNINNKLLLELIKERIGHGNININSPKILMYTISTKEGILKFIECTSKYLRTPKIEKYNDMIKFLNLYKKQNLSLAKLDISSYNTNGWLSGYLESNGSFKIDATEYKGYSFCPMFTLKHKKIKNKLNYENLMQSIAEFFNIQLKLISKETDLYIVIRYGQLDNLFKYLSRFPLFGYKYLAYSQLKYSVEFSDSESKASIEEIRKNMNQEIPGFVCEHLKFLPKIDEGFSSFKEE